MLQAEVQQFVFWNQKTDFLLSSDIDAYWIAYIIEEGSCEFRIGDSEGVAKTGDILICPPYTIFERKIIDPLSFYFFRFSLKNDLFDNNHLCASFSIKQKNRLSSTNEMLQKIQFDDSPQLKSFRNHLLNDILFMYFYENSLIIQTVDNNNIRDELIRDSLVLLTNLKQDAPTITEIADSLNINPCHFSRKFKQVMGITPIEYRNKIRLQEAQKLLIETNDSIEKISETCGYNTAFYFSRIFTKYLGEAPSSYRNNHKV